MAVSEYQANSFEVPGKHQATLSGNTVISMTFRNKLKQCINVGCLRMIFVIKV